MSKNRYKKEKKKKIDLEKKLKQYLLNFEKEKKKDLKKSSKTKINNKKIQEKISPQRKKKVASPTPTPTPSPKLNKTLEKFKKEFLPSNSTSGKVRLKKIDQK